MSQVELRKKAPDDGMMGDGRPWGNGKDKKSVRSSLSLLLVSKVTCLFPLSTA